MWTRHVRRMHEQSDECISAWVRWMHEPCHTCECECAYTCVFAGTRAHVIPESCRTYSWVVSRIPMSHFIKRNEPGHDTSKECMSNVTHVNASVRILGSVQVRMCMCTRASFEGKHIMTSVSVAILRAQCTHIYIEYVCECKCVYTYICYIYVYIYICINIFI